MRICEDVKGLAEIHLHAQGGQAAVRIRDFEQSALFVQISATGEAALKNPTLTS